LILFSLFIFCIVALSISFFLGQLTASEFLLNAAGNITGLVFSFLGGIWIPLELAGDTIAKLARFTPTFYYGEALEKTNNLHDYSGASLAPVFADLGIMLLFAAALFAVALAVGHLRMQSAEAGGNAAAARTRS
jgi:ABC-2 type transport system permease protein